MFFITCHLNLHVFVVIPGASLLHETPKPMAVKQRNVGHELGWNGGNMEILNIPIGSMYGIFTRGLLIGKQFILLFTRGFTNIPGGCLGFLNHHHYIYLHVVNFFW